MSSVISDKKQDLSLLSRDIIPAMPTRESLSDYIRRNIAEKNLTVREVEKRSRGAISAGYVHDIIQGKTKNPSIDKLKALAKGLGVSEEEIFAVARGKAPASEDDLFRMMLDELYEKRQNVTGKEREFLENNIKMLLNEMERRQRA